MKIKHSTYWLVALISITIFLYYSSIHFEFTHWDDDRQVTGNVDIRELSIDNLKTIFSSFYIGMYQPLSTLTYAIEYSFTELNPVVYHIDNLILHLFNLLIVFSFLQILFGTRNFSIAATALFAVHPLQVEAVAWLSARSTLLFTFNFFLSLIFYIKYIRNNKPIFYILSLLFFLLSLLSKVMAVSLPFVLISIDFFEKRKVSQKTIFEKIPFFIFSFVFGIIVIFAREEAGHIHNVQSYTFIDRVFIMSYQLSLYIVKVVVPSQLSVYYPNPLVQNGWLPIIYYLSLLPVGAIIFLLFTYAKYIKKEVYFGFAFFVFAILFVLKFVTVGNQLITERYMYFAAIGLYIGIYFMIKPFINFRKWRIVINLLFAAYLIVLSITTFHRLKVWEKDLTLFTDFVKTSPNVSLGWYSLGITYNRNKSYNTAIRAFNKSIQINPEFSSAYYNRAISHYDLSDYSKAIKDFNKCLILSSDTLQHAAIYNYFGIIYGKGFNFRKAIDYFKLSININPKSANTLFNLGHLYFTLGDYEKAKKHLNASLIINPENTQTLEAISKILSFEKDRSEASAFYMNSGIELAKTKNYLAAINFFTTAITKDSTNFLAFQNRALTFYRMGKIDAAKKDILEIIRRGGKIDQSILNLFLK